MTNQQLVDALFVTGMVFFALFAICGFAEASPIWTRLWLGLAAMFVIASVWAKALA